MQKKERKGVVKSVILAGKGGGDENGTVRELALFLHDVIIQARISRFSRLWFVKSV